MNKYLVSAALAAVIGAAAFTAPASAQVGVGINVGPQGGYHDGYHGGYQGGYYNGPRRYNSGPSVRVYSGRAAYRDDCYTKRTVKFRNGRKVVTERRICN
jgi:hypothetical protein